MGGLIAHILKFEDLIKEDLHHSIINKIKSYLKMKCKYCRKIWFY